MLLACFVIQAPVSCHRLKNDQIYSFGKTDKNMEITFKYEAEVAKPKFQR